jgi:hypothetical protein
MPAAVVKAIHGGRGAVGRKVAEYLPYSIPWSWLFGMPNRSAAALAAKGRLNAFHIPSLRINPDDALLWQHGGLTRSLGASDWALSPLSPQDASVEDIYRWHQAIASVTADLVSAQDADESERFGSALMEYWNTVRLRYDLLPPTTEGLAPLPPYAEAVRRLADDRYAEPDGDAMQALARFATELNGPLDVIVTDLGRPTG